MVSRGVKYQQVLTKPKPVRLGWTLLWRHVSIAAPRPCNCLSPCYATVFRCMELLSLSLIKHIGLCLVYATMLYQREPAHTYHHICKWFIHDRLYIHWQHGVCFPNKCFFEMAYILYAHKFGIHCMWQHFKVVLQKFSLFGGIYLRTLWRGRRGEGGSLRSGTSCSLTILKQKVHVRQRNWIFRGVF